MLEISRLSMAPSNRLAISSTTILLMENSECFSKKKDFREKYNVCVCVCVCVCVNVALDFEQAT